MQHPDHQHDPDTERREPTRTATEAESGEQTVDPRRPEPGRTADHAEGDPDKPPEQPPKRPMR